MNLQENASLDSDRAPGIVNESLFDDPRITEALKEYVAAIEEGRLLSRQDFLKRHAEIAEELAECLEGLEFIRGVSPEISNPLNEDAADPVIADSQVCSKLALGDYRIVKEIGRGGMGVVYEADQLSLGRKVALKVLPFAATLDPRHLQRFHNEARAAATLDHPHIVDVYGVGCERGVHYYAMRLIEGHTLAQIINQLQELHHQDSPMPGLVSDVVVDSAAEDKSAQAGSMTEAYVPTEASAAKTKSVIQGAVSTKKSKFSLAYFRSVAELGMHVAEALDLGHQQGVVHRDIKPSNLMLDERGKVWVTDFGLAHVESSGTLTMTGDLIGTLRYMSPEQAMAKRVVMDHRSDVYSLGATLYELLTLQSAVSGEDRQEILRKIAFEEPVKPRQLNKAIPAELETIVLKAMEKNPAERYATAQELANDLRRYLQHEPIRAQPPTVIQRSRKWARRHPTVVAATAVGAIVALIMLGGGLGWLARDEAARQKTTEQVVSQALADVENFYKQGNWSEALSAAKRARGLLKVHRGSAKLQARVDDWVTDLRMVQELEEIRFFPASAGEVNNFAVAEAEAKYREAFRSFGVDVRTQQTTETARWIQSRNVAKELIIALDDWSRLKRVRGAKGWRQLLVAARRADTSKFRNKLRGCDRKQ